MRFVSLSGRLAFCLLAALILCPAWSAQTPLVQRQVIDAFTYPNDAAAQAAWIPAEGSLPVTAMTEPVAGRRGLRLPADLTGNRRRAAWDRALSLDLSRADRFSFWLYVDDPSPIAPYFSFYFRSGDGWYSTTTPVERGWRKVTLNKADFRTEGTPLGWDRITGVRLSAWKTKEAVTFLAVDDLQASSSSVVVVLGDRAFTPDGGGEEKTVRAQAQKMGRMLERLGIEAGVLNDTDVETGALAGRAVAIFPYNPSISEKEAEAVERFLTDGGKAILFYAAPARVLAALGMEESGWHRQQVDGQFAQVAFLPGDIIGLPESFAQTSWNIRTVKPVAPGARIAAEWRDAKGVSTGLPALAVSDRGAFFSHILLSEDPSGGERMMLALLGKYLPEVWPDAARRALARSGSVGEYETVEQVAAFVEKAGPPAAHASLVASTRSREEAGKAISEKRYVDALAAAHRAHAETVRAYAAAQKPQPGELRAVWCHSAFGVRGMTWDESAKALADNGMTAVVPNMLWGGRAYYASRVLPVDESVATQGDQIAACVAAAKKYGVQVHVWKVNWNLLNAPKPFLERMRAERRTQKDPQGKDIDWLCPTHPDNFALERDAMLEVARNYAVDGIHFDYIRYPGTEGCYCAGCRERFAAWAGVTVTNWPDDVIKGAHRERYLEFRRHHITRLVETVSREARRAKPGIKISAAVFSNWPECRDSIGQDWGYWVKQGYLDFVCPMDYTPSAGVYEQMVKRQSEAIAGAVPFIPGVGVTLGDWQLPPDQVVLQVNVARRNGARGFILFDYQPYVAREVLPVLRAGVTAR